MRITFGINMNKIATRDKKTVVLTGDLGHGVFEELAENVGPRFINAGVAEHNMITAAAGLSYTSLRPWVYSVAPFVTIKVMEELRNDVALQDRDVKIVGLGGGYDYAIAGPTHHVLQDVAMMLSLPNFRVFAPALEQDLEPIMKKMLKRKGPDYLRLTVAEKTVISLPKYSPTRRIVTGEKITVLALGSIIYKVLPAVLHLEKNLVDLWLVSEFPLQIPKELLQSIKKTRIVCVVEEHVQTGGLGHHFNHMLIEKKVSFKHFIHLYAKGYISHRYGSRDFYLKESGLDKDSIKQTIESLI